MKNKLLEAIELANGGDWDKAHRIVQDIEHELAYWIHANLHREEGDVSNSKYWYKRAGRDYTEMDLGEERELIKKEIEDN
ncbi:MAG: hypothetical protein GWO07_01235 [Candidatus Dadabacteria bacterium]|nr:hypothetical protein [Candidatus Dadabacteria bacterium]